MRIRNYDHTIHTYLGIAAAALVSLFSQGCSPGLVRDDSQGTTKGLIYVSSPKIVSRETLFNDRTREVAWLEGQLKNSDSENVTDLQGLTEENRYSGLEAGIRAQVGPQVESVTSNLTNQVENNKDKRDEDRLDHQISMAKKRAELVKLAGVTNDQTGASSDDPSSTSTDATSSNQVGSTDKTNFNASGQVVGQSLDNLKAMKELLGSSKDIGQSKASTSAINRFRARLALRDEMRAELLDAQLDDRHQLLGSTVYRLKVDSTIYPGNDTSDWAVVQYEVLKSKMDDQVLIEGFKGALKKRVKEEATLLRDIAFNYGIEELPDHFQEEMRHYAKIAFSHPIRPTKCNRAAFSEEKTAAVTITKPAEPLGSLDSGTGCEIVEILKEQSELACSGERKVLDDWISQTLGWIYNNDPGLAQYMSVAIDKQYPYEVNVILKEESEFIKKINESPTNVYAYAATPKEVVQRISQVASDRDATTLLFDIGFLTGNMGGNAGLRKAIASEQLTQALRQQPLVVGYADEARFEPLNDVSLARFGWIQGPQFRIDRSRSWDGRTSWNFRHKVVQNGLSATVVVPAWWDNLRMKVCRSWRSSEQISKGTTACNGTEEQTLNAPVKPNYISLIELFSNRLRPLPLWMSPGASARDKPIEVGESADIMIYGWNLWRNVQVTLRTQRADEIYVLPDATGIIARFGKVADFHGKDGMEDLRGVIVWTSHGSASAGNVKVARKEKKKDDAAGGTSLTATLSPHLVVTKGKKYEFRLPDGKMPTGLKSLRIEVKTGQGNWSEVAKGSIEIGPSGTCGKGRICFLLMPEDEKKEFSPKSTFALESRVVIESGSGEKITLVSSAQPIYQATENEIKIDAKATRDLSNKEIVRITVTFPIVFASLKPALDLSTLKFVPTDLKAFSMGSCADQAGKGDKEEAANGHKPISCIVEINVTDKNKTEFDMNILGAKKEVLGIPLIHVKID